MLYKRLSLPVLITILISIGSVLSATTTTTTDPLNQLEDNDSCYQICSKTYSLHTYPKFQNLNACKTGCRFSALNQLNLAKQSTTPLDPKLVATKCLNSCAAAYDVEKFSSEHFACSIGCNNTIIGDNKKPEVLSSGKEAEPDISEVISDDNTDNNNQLFISPLHLFRSMIRSMLDRGSVFVERSSMSVFVTNNEGEQKLVVIQSEPEVVVHQYPDLMQSNEYDSETILGSEERTTTDNIRPKLDLSIWTQENPLEVGIDSRHHSDNSWSNCFSYQSGVPRWLLASILFLAIFVLAWICCATTATAPEQHIRRKVGQGSDLKYLCLYEEPIKLVIDEKLPTYEELEAEIAQKCPKKTNNDFVDNNKESIP